VGSSTRRREGILWPLLLLAAVGVVVAAVLRDERGAARARVANEDGALALARELVAAEQAYRTRTGRFGWLEDLREAGLLPAGLATRAQPHGLQALGSGYQIDVLLPTGRAVNGVVPLGASGSSTPDAELATRHVAVVARPLRPGVDGFRTWYVDESAHAFVSEGVSDLDSLADNPLPARQVTRAHRQEELGFVWRHADDLERD
jgi:hypothetical protein